jgi:hypothetical protein
MHVLNFYNIENKICLILGMIGAFTRPDHKSFPVCTIKQDMDQCFSTRFAQDQDSEEGCAWPPPASGKPVGPVRVCLLREK